MLLTMLVKVHVVWDIILREIFSIHTAKGFVFLSICCSIRDIFFQLFIVYNSTFKKYSCLASYIVVHSILHSSLFRLVYPVRGGTRRMLDKDMVISGYDIPKGVSMISLGFEWKYTLKHRENRWKLEVVWQTPMLWVCCLFAIRP